MKGGPTIHQCSHKLCVRVFNMKSQKDAQNLKVLFYE